MRAVRWLWLVVGACVFLSAAVVICGGGGGGGGGMTLNLERAFPTSHDGIKMSQHKKRDRVRHGRLLQQQSSSTSSVNGVADFHVYATYDPFDYWFYFTRVRLGSPPKEFYVQIDTGSDVLWVSCAACKGCPTSSELQIQHEFFDPSSSSTVSPISCSDQRCTLGAQASDFGCSSHDQCSYTFQYGDGSGTSGVYISDLMHFDTVVGTTLSSNSLSSNSSAQVVFGCSTSQTGDLTKGERAVDGVFGFGRQGFSLISQLASQGLTPHVFSHCLSGTNGGGGILVLGEIMEPNMVYTPLVPSQPHYNVNLQSISVNGQILGISPSVFSTSNSQGTIIDSGTSLAYLVERAYQPFIDAITQTVIQYARPFVSKGIQCYLVNTSVSETFPSVSLNFAGGASMVLRPEDYLLQWTSVNGTTSWCIGFQKSPGQDITILGDLVLKDKIVVYDLAGQRIGWVNYDCSQKIGNTASSHHDLHNLIAFCISAFLFQLLVLGRFPIL